jgi:hypothetical protein
MRSYAGELMRGRKLHIDQLAGGRSPGPLTGLFRLGHGYRNSLHRLGPRGAPCDRHDKAGVQFFDRPGQREAADFSDEIPKFFACFPSASQVDFLGNNRSEFRT